MHASKHQVGVFVQNNNIKMKPDYFEQNVISYANVKIRILEVLLLKFSKFYRLWASRFLIGWSTCLTQNEFGTHISD